MNLFNRYKFQNYYMYLLFLIIFVFTSIYSFIGIWKHLHFQTFGWDTAIFDQQIFLVNHLKAPFSSLHGFNGLGDHFHPLLYVIGFIGYKIWTDAGMLYIIQSLIACLSAWPYFLINAILLKKLNVSKNQRLIINFLLILMYLLSVSFQFMVVGEYNDAPNLALPLLFGLYFLLKRNSLGYWISFIAVILVKEEYSLLGIPLSIFIALEYKDYKKAIITFILGISTFYFLTYKLMPFFSGSTSYIFFSDNNRPSVIIGHFLTHPWDLLVWLFDNPQKRMTIFVSLFSFGFLPVFSLKNLIMPGFNLAVRFYDKTVLRRYEFNNQYSAGLLPVLAVAATQGLVNIINFFGKKKMNFLLVCCYLVIVIALQDMIFHGPINNLLKPQFYEFSQSQKDAHELISQVPKDKVISANNSLLPHLSQRREFYLLPKVGKAEYVAVDLSEGPNKFAPLNSSLEMEGVVKSLISSHQFQVVWRKNQALLLKRI